MLIRILRPVVRLVLWVFFRRIEVRGRDRIPADRPLIVVSNHPNVMIDTLILGLCAPGETPRYLGKSTLFKRPLYTWFLSRLGVIPVARAEDPGASKFRNRDMLRVAYQTLREGHSLVVFPEGASHPETRLRDLKPGTARIALRAEMEADGRAGVLIVPVGLTYSDPGTFRSDAYVHFGEAIEARDFLEAYRENHAAAEEALTALIRERLVALTLHIERAELEAVIRETFAVYASIVAAELSDSAEVSRRVRAEQEIVRAVHHLAGADPELVRSFGRRLRGFHRKLKRLRLDLDAFSQEGFSTRASRLVAALLLWPLALYGFLHNALPYYLPRLFVRPYRDQREIVGTVKMSAGFVLFTAYYLGLTGAAYLLTDLRHALLYGLTLPVSGLFTLFYQERILRRWPLWRSLFLTRRRRHYLERLSEEHATIIWELDAIKERYLAMLS